LSSIGTLVLALSSKEKLAKAFEHEDSLVSAEIDSEGEFHIKQTFRKKYEPPTGHYHVCHKLGRGEKCLQDPSSGFYDNAKTEKDSFTFTCAASCTSVKKQYFVQTAKGKFMVSKGGKMAIAAKDPKNNYGKWLIEHPNEKKAEYRIWNVGAKAYLEWCGVTKAPKITSKTRNANGLWVTPLDTKNSNTLLQSFAETQGTVVEADGKTVPGSMLSRRQDKQKQQTVETPSADVKMRKEEKQKEHKASSSLLQRMFFGSDDSSRLHEKQLNSEDSALTCEEVDAKYGQEDSHTVQHACEDMKKNGGDPDCCAPEGQETCCADEDNCSAKEVHTALEMTCP